MNEELNDESSENSKSKIKSQMINNKSSKIISKKLEDNKLGKQGTNKMYPASINKSKKLDNSFDDIIIEDRSDKKTNSIIVKREVTPKSSGNRKIIIEPKMDNNLKLDIFDDKAKIIAIGIASICGFYLFKHEIIKFLKTNPNSNLIVIGGVLVLASISAILLLKKINEDRERFKSLSSKIYKEIYNALKEANNDDNSLDGIREKDIISIYCKEKKIDEEFFIKNIYVPHLFKLLSDNKNLSCESYLINNEFETIWRIKNDEDDE